MELTPLQVEAVKFACSKSTPLVRMGAGKGKTLVFYSVLKYRQLKDPTFSRAFVVTSNRGMDSFRRSNFYDYKVLMLDSATIKKIDFESAREYEVIVVSKTILTQDNLPLLKRIISECSIVTIDEIHEFRNFGNKSAEILYFLTRSYTGVKLTMTATLEYKNLEDIFGVFRLVDDKLFPNWFDFLKEYVVQKKKTIKTYRKIATLVGMRKVLVDQEIYEKVGYKNVPELMKKIEPYCFVESSDDFQINYSTLFYELSSSDSETYENTLAGLGLDHIYKYRLSAVDGSDVEFVTCSTTESLWSDTGIELFPTEIFYGTKVTSYGFPYTVTKISEETSDLEITRRLIPLQRFLSTLDVKYSLLKSIVVQGGCLIYCNFKDTLYSLETRLKEDFPDRNIIGLTGDDNKLEVKVSALGQDDIVLITRVAVQSLDFYQRRAVLFENITNPGLFKQFIGRITRQNAEHREVDAIILYGERTIEQYFYERFIYLVENSSYEDLKAGVRTSLTPEQLAVIKGTQNNELAALKECLLWKRGHKKLFS